MQKCDEKKLRTKKSGNIGFVWFQRDYPNEQNGPTLGAWGLRGAGVWVRGDCRTLRANGFVD